MQTQLACANARTRVEARIRFYTGSPFKNTRFHLSHTHAHTHAHMALSRTFSLYANAHHQSGQINDMALS